jgi:ADP-ribose pyrophosphatase YjhB (NUDIX family)
LLRERRALRLGHGAHAERLDVAGVRGDAAEDGAVGRAGRAPSGFPRARPGATFKVADRVVRRMPMHTDAQKWSELPAKFTLHDAPAELRMQCFLVIRDGEERVAMAKLQDTPGWAFPAETMRFNEAPDEAVARVARSWFEVPPSEVWLERVLSFPATGPEDSRWYVIFVYGAKAPADLKATPDTEKVQFFDPATPPDAFAFSHVDVWRALQS